MRGLVHAHHLAGVVYAKPLGRLYGVAGDLGAEHGFITHQYQLDIGVFAQCPDRGRDHDTWAVITAHGVQCDGKESAHSVVDDFRLPVNDDAGCVHPAMSGYILREALNGRPCLPFSEAARGLFLVLLLGLDHLAPAVETIGADVVPTVHFTGGGLDGERSVLERIVGTTHAALRGGGTGLLNCHDKDLRKAFA